MINVAEREIEGIVVMCCIFRIRRSFQNLFNVHVSDSKGSCGCNYLIMTRDVLTVV